MDSVNINTSSTVESLITWSHCQSIFLIFWFNYHITLYMKTDEKATEFITKGKEEHIPNDPACHICFRTPNQTNLPNLRVRRFHPLLQLPLYGYSSCNLSVSLRPRRQRQDLRLQEMRVTKAVTISPLLWSSHVWSMIMISKLTVTRMKQKSHITI